MAESLSLSVVESNFEQAKWEMAERFTQKAELLYSNNDHRGAYKLCEKVLAAIPQYCPARMLMGKCVENGKLSGADEQELQPGHDASPSPTEFGSDFDDTVDLEVQPRKTQKKTVQFLEEDTLDLELSDDSPGPSVPQKGHSSATANTLDQGGRELRLEGHFFQNQPVEVFLGLKELLRSEDKANYVCPVSNCNSQFRSRVICVNHFRVAHLETVANEVQVQPFVCKTCTRPVRLRTLQEVIRHGLMVHPRYQFVVIRQLVEGTIARITVAPLTISRKQLPESHVSWPMSTAPNQLADDICPNTVARSILSDDS